ncbi:MAG: CHAT domain-containing protein [Flavobacteriaceae bacterium]|nr:CHAT domain-containing protein [Flavobacteriaceae bacterium]
MKLPTQPYKWRFALLIVFVCYFSTIAQDTNPVSKALQSGKEAQQLGNHSDAITFFRKGLILIDSTAENAAYKRYELFNEIGTSKQRMLELDSSSFYFRKALSFLNNAERNPKNEFYSVGILKNRIGLNEFNTGKMEASIISMKEAVNAFRQYVDAVPDGEERKNGLQKQYASVDNLSGFYRGIGENERGLDLAEYSYQQKLTFLEEDDPNITISRLILGHINLLARNHDAAGEYLDQALEHIDQVAYAHTYGLMVRASTYENVGDFENAEKTYRECERIYREGANGTYSLVFLDALVEMSRFYAKKGDADKAIALAREGYEFTQSEAFTNDLIAFYHIQNRAQVHFLLKQYAEAKKYSEEALHYFSNDRIAVESQLDSIRNEIRKPAALYLKSKSQYYLTQSKDEATLQPLLKETDQALAILDRQKTKSTTAEDLATLLTDNGDLIDFRKQLNWDLYEHTKDKKYLDDLVSLHESALYTRIRSRLNLKKVAFANVPKEVLDRESQLREGLTTSLNSSENIDDFFQVQMHWESFLDSLKTTYHAYHEMRYARIQEPIDGIQERLNDQTTVVRYLFMEDQLYAFVLGSASKTMIALPEINTLDDHVNTVNDPRSDFDAVSTSLSKLYELLWKPIEDEITTENVVIIPDEIIFNISFDVLTPTPINDYSDLAENSLLAQYNLSYNYSLFLAAEDVPFVAQKENFVSFAPEFSSEMKNDYRNTITDSVDVDHTYLSLLPQPFSVEIVKKFASQFNGVTYLNDASTKNAFTQFAKNHKIIHIATHAESNNLNPELSRLIFAKDAADASANNYLHTYEIYNHNLASQLTTLTACETGKPSFQPGEGMISLAHAFNYAGSESILTSLWKIDEQTSTEIVDSFYTYLGNGMAKDKALRRAKLDYLANAQGRTQAPFYWSGLVLMGDTQTVPLRSGYSIWAWITVFLVGLLLIWGITRWKRQST